MNLIQITPGAGGMYCGNCFRDNALVAELKRLGHDTLMLPLYLPMTLDEADQSAQSPVFFGGINVYLQQQSSLFRHAPNWLRNVLSSQRILKWAAGRAAKTRAADLGDLTLSMLRGEEGRQSRELDELIHWLRPRPRPDAVFISNALLLGLARRLRSELKTPVVCMLQGEDDFLDALPEPFRAQCWEECGRRAGEVDALLAPSRYFADRMAARFKLPAERVQVVHNGIRLEGFQDKETTREPGSNPVLGYFARMCPEKGLDRLVEAYLLARKTVPGLKLKVGGGCGPGDAAFVEGIRERLKSEGALADTEFCPNVDREGKLRFFQSLDFFSVPARCSEAFGLYLVEALAAGVPVIQPRHCAYPEIVERGGGGVICDDTIEALAAGIVDLATHPETRAGLSDQARRAARECFSVEAMTTGILKVVEGLPKPG